MSFSHTRVKRYTTITREGHLFFVLHHQSRLSSPFQTHKQSAHRSWYFLSPCSITIGTSSRQGKSADRITPETQAMTSAPAAFNSSCRFTKEGKCFSLRRHIFVRSMQTRARQNKETTAEETTKLFEIQVDGICLASMRAANRDGVK